MTQRGELNKALTPRERDVAYLIGEAWSNKAIAGRLWLTKRTVESHLYNAAHKLGHTYGDKSRAACDRGTMGVDPPATGEGDELVRMIGFVLGAYVALMAFYAAAIVYSLVLVLGR